MSEDDSIRITRRAAIGSAGAVAALATLGWTSAARADADPPPPPGPRGGRNLGASPKSIPTGNPTPTGSALVSGITYRYFGEYDFLPWDLSAPRTWDDGWGLYSSGPLQVQMQPPPGAVLYDMEWYMAPAGSASLEARIQPSGDAYLWDLFGGNHLAGTTTTRVVAPATANGPFRTGTSLVFRMSGASARIQGLRVGFKNYPVGTTMLASPIRVYQTPGSSKISSGSTRTHSLASVVPAGAVGAVVKLTAFNTEKAGDLVLTSGAVTPGKNSAVSWFASRQKFGSVTPVAVPAARTVKVKCTGGRTQYALDVIGYLA